MASTSTNKQPLLVDRVFHYVFNLDTHSNNGIDIAGTNDAKPIVNAVGTDGAIIEDIYSIARSTTSADINLYVSNVFDYLRPNEAVLVGVFTSATNIGGTTHWENMPRVLTPVPPSGGDRYNQAFYLPKGKVLWAARNSSNSSLTDGPILGCQGGWY